MGLSVSHTQAQFKYIQERKRRKENEKSSSQSYKQIEGKLIINQSRPTNSHSFINYNKIQNHQLLEGSRLPFRNIQIENGRNNTKSNGKIVQETTNKLSIKNSFEVFNKTIKLQSIEVKQKQQTLMNKSKQQNNLKQKNDQDEQQQVQCSLFANKCTKQLQQTIQTTQQNTMQLNRSFSRQDWYIPVQTKSIIFKNRQIKPSHSIMLFNKFTKDQQIMNEVQESEQQIQWKNRRQLMKDVIAGKRNKMDQDFMIGTVCRDQHQGYPYRYIEQPKNPLNLCKQR